MKMKLCKKAGIIALSFLFLSVAHAQEKAPYFTGLAIGAGVVQQYNKVDLQTPQHVQPARAKQRIASVDVSYGIPVAGNFITTIGASYGFGESDFGKQFIFAGGRNSGYAGLKMRNQISAYVAPGLRLSDRVLVYGKVGVHQALGKYKDATLLKKNIETLTGLGYGAGVSFALNHHVELGAEVQRVKYSGNDDIKPSTTMYMLNARYRF